MEELPNETRRRRAIAWATALAAGTPLAPQAYERALLEQYAQGQLTLAQVLHQLDTRVQHVLYRSQATRSFEAGQLTDLLAQSQTWNETHGITGLLCYCNGHFVQLLEGDPEPVQALYARIRQDARHQQVITLSEDAGPLRLFPDWRIAFVQVQEGEFYWLLSQLDGTRTASPSPMLPVQDPHLLTLLEAFSSADLPS